MFICMDAIGKLANIFAGPVLKPTLHMLDFQVALVEPRRGDLGQGADGTVQGPFLENKQPPHIDPIHRVIDAVPVPVAIAALPAQRVQGRETPGVGVVVSPDKPRQAGVGVEQPARKADGQASVDALSFVGPRRLFSGEFL